MGLLQDRPRDTVANYGGRPMTFEEAMNRVYLGRSIAFFGAGFSRDAINLSNEKMLSGGGLAEKLTQALQEEDGLSLALEHLPS